MNLRSTPIRHARIPLKLRVVVSERFNLNTKTATDARAKSKHQAYKKNDKFHSISEKTCTIT
jgi:hypothetical protein